MGFFGFFLCGFFIANPASTLSCRSGNIQESSAIPPRNLVSWTQVKECLINHHRESHILYWKKEKKEKRIFIYPFHAIKIRHYDGSIYIIHTVEYFVYPLGKVYMYRTSWKRVRAPNHRICVLVAMLGIFLRKGKGRPGITKGFVLIRVPEEV